MDRREQDHTPVTAINRCVIPYSQTKIANRFDATILRRLIPLHLRKVGSLGLNSMREALL